MERRNLLQTKWESCARGTNKWQKVSVLQLYNVSNLLYCDSGRKKYFLVILLWQFDCNIIWKQIIAWKVLNISNVDIISSWKAEYLSYCVCFSNRYDNSSMKMRWQCCSLPVWSYNKYLLDFKELIIFVFEKFGSFS